MDVRDTLTADEVVDELLEYFISITSISIKFVFPRGSLSMITLSVKALPPANLRGALTTSQVRAPRCLIRSLLQSRKPQSAQGLRIAWAEHLEFANHLNFHGSTLTDDAPGIYELARAILTANYCRSEK